MNLVTLPVPLVLAADPLLDGAIGFSIVCIVLVKVVVAFTLLLIGDAHGLVRAQAVGRHA